MALIDRRTFLKRTGAATGALTAAGPLGAFSARALAAGPQRAAGYGPLRLRTDARGNQLLLPEGFDFVTVQQQGDPMRDGSPVPGIFDGMGAFPGRDGTTALLRNHENRERPGEQRVVTAPGLEYDPHAAGGVTKVRVDPRAVVRKEPPYVVETFPVLGGTSTNCAGGETPWGTWITCEEVVKRSPSGRKHGYCFEAPAAAGGPVEARPATALGRFAHEAIAVHAGIFYLTEDQALSTSGGELLGAAFYRFVPDRAPGRGVALADLTGRLEALAIKGEPRANMDAGRSAGDVFDVAWVPVPEPDHDDDTNDRRDRVPGFTPTRVQAADRGAAVFDREEGAWVGDGVVWFDCTSGGPVDGGQVWAYDPGRETLTLVFQSQDRARLENPDNVVVVPSTGDVLLQEDGGGDNWIRGLTRDGRLYDFAKSVTSDSEFCGGCFDPGGDVLYVNQQGDRGELPHGPEGGQAVTYAIFGPFAQRDGRARR